MDFAISRQQWEIGPSHDDLSIAVAGIAQLSSQEQLQQNPTQEDGEKQSEEAQGADGGSRNRQTVGVKVRP
jgi:hypothetical protein